MSGEVDWKVSQLVHLAKYGYFSKPDPKGFTAACQNVFHRARETPSRKLEDLAAVLSKTFDEINELVPDSDISDEVRHHLAPFYIFNSLWLCDCRSNNPLTGESLLEHCAQKRTEDDKEEPLQEERGWLDYSSLPGALSPNGLRDAPQCVYANGDLLWIGHVLQQSNGEKEIEESGWRAQLAPSGRRYSAVLVVSGPPFLPQPRRFRVVGSVATHHAGYLAASLGCKTFYFFWAAAEALRGSSPYNLL